MANKKLIIGLSIGAGVIITAILTAKPILLNRTVKATGLDKAQLQNKTFSELWKIYKG